MSASNRGILAVIGLGVAAGAGIAIYLAFVSGPADDARAVRAEIEEWDRDKWQPLRGCLLGDEPLAADGRDALLLRWASAPALMDEAACLGQFHDLARPKTQAAGSVRVEAAWRELRASMGVLSNRYALLAPGGHEGIGPVAEALTTADQAYDELRTAAGMAPLERTGPAVVSLGTMTAMGDELAITTAPTAIDIRPSGPDQAGTVTRLSAESTIRRATTPHVVRAVPTLGWGAWTERTAGGQIELYAGAIADDGTSGAGTLVGVIGEEHADGQLELALDGGAHRAIVFTVGGRYRPLVTVARSSDSGSSWTIAPPIQASSYQPNPAAGRLDLLYTNDDGAMIWLGLAAAHLAQARPVVTSMNQVLSTCATTDTLWLVDSERLYVADAPGQIVGPIGRAPGYDLLACDDDVAVFRGLQRTVRCTREACDENGPPATNVSSVAGSAFGGAPLIATTLHDLLLVWATGATRPAVYRLPGIGSSVAAIARWGDRTHAVLRGEAASGYSLVELPANATSP